MSWRQFLAVLMLLIAVVVVAQLLTGCQLHACATDKSRAGCYLDPECHCPGERRWPA